MILDSVPIYDTTALPQPSIIRSTIIENSKVYTEWNGTSYTLNPLKEYEIYRSENEGSFILTAVLDSVFNDTATTEIYTTAIVGSVRCV